MARKILDCNIKTIDEKSHIRFWSIKDVDIDSIKFLVDITKKVKPRPVVIESTPKSTIIKKIKKTIIKKNSKK